ncbi:hypothetical protein Z517_05140 [Fonsecaea pedrosoi CBS 271.37]|uniref:C2H2-type domain-containing protein n=1 Tax=Fonsecaea pedrosoi CBS 271.37 TaxID=1442368 RepID=A0A0D2GMD1_9EURO|nr:uncharacterized protein Z517_05140 [Fonsecaea pedrosoi CBS 271.37]KIW82113.1 hypothetical protein Z517_05140 [Fonsecaea pedrosoi CBS 271.37]
MSYPLLTVYGAPYESQEENMNKSYNPGRHTSANNRYATQAPYSEDVRQQHYDSSAYGWTGQPQQDHPGGTGQRTTYNGNGWDTGRTQIPSRDDRTQHANYAIHTTPGGGGDGGRSYFISPSSNIAGQSNSGLNNPAYASGLGDAVLQQYGHHQQHSTTASTSVQRSTAVNWVRSPITTHNTSRHDSNPPSNYGFWTGPSSHNQPNSLSASATALTGNVGARFQQASAAMRGHASASPVTEASASVQQSASQRSASPFYQPQIITAQGHGHPPSTTPQTNYRATNSAAPNTQEKARQIANTGQHRRRPSLEAAQRHAQPQAQSVSSISNLVTHSAEEPARLQNTATLEPQSMPSYIDPTQVFNPFHKEHQRRRQQVAAREEAEAKRKAEQEAAAKMKAEAEAIAKKKAEEALAAAKNQEQVALTAAAAAPATGAAEKKTKQTQKAPRPSQEPLSENEPQHDKHSSPRDDEADMASGLRAMMEKMQEFRNRDPNLFQKLWDDMRKTSSVPSVAIPSPSPSLQTSTNAAPPNGQDRQQPLTNTVASAPLTLPKAPFQRPTPIPTTETARSKSDALSGFSQGPRLNGYRVVVENNPEGLPDLGSFPAERRIRSTYNGKHSSETDATGQTTTKPKTGPAATNALPNGVFAPTAQQTSNPTSTPKVPAIEKTAPLTQGLPPRKPSGETMWPESKRNVLAAVAVKFLKASPENEKVEISPEDIHGMLEQNPSYIDLCLMLENKGLKFHRGQFARQLLNEIPQLRGPSKTPVVAAPAIPVPGPVPAPEISVAPRLPATVHPEPLLVNASTLAPSPNFSKGFPRPKPPAFPGPHPQPRYPQMQRARPAKPLHQARPEPAPGSKEAMARKRDFSEVVDLTALSDNEDYVMSRKQARIESPPLEPKDLFQQYQNQPSTTNASSLAVPFRAPGYPEPLRFNPSLPQHQLGHNPPPTHPSPQLAPPSVVPPPAQHSHRSIRLLAKPIDKKEALRKTYYDARTIARDILIAAGRHPTERPLNAHMAGLLGKYVEMDSDLSTFDWNAIDPGGPPVPQVPYADVPTEPPRFRLGEAGIRRSRAHVPPPSAAGTAPRHVLPDTAKRKMTPPASAPAPTTAPTTATDKAKDKVVPPVAQVQSRPQQPQPHVAVPQVSVRSQGSHTSPRSEAADADERPKSTPKPITPLKRKRSLIPLDSSPVSERRRSTRSTSSQVAASGESKTMSSGPLFPSVKRRGRPPGAKTLHSSIGAMKRAAVQDFSPIEVSISSPASPSLPVFKCRWRHCKSQLHNLETLRKHVAKVHRPTPDQLREEGGYICWWKRCEYLVDDGDGSLHPSEIFDTRKDWLAHIEEHMKKVASTLGDGPTTKTIGKQNRTASKPFDVSRFLFNPPTQPSSTSLARTLSHTDPQTLLRDKARFLSDEQGRITTPDVSVKSVQDHLEPDTMTLLRAEHSDAEKHAQRSFMKTHRTEKSSPRAVAEETLKAMAARKAKIGPGLDRGGCILVNEARRSTLIQNPGIQRVVDADY